MRLYVHMMLCGSICTMLYLFFNNLPSYELPLKWKRFLIRVNIGFYLLPVPWLAAEVKELLRWMLEKTGVIFPARKGGDIFDATSMWNSFIVMDQDGRIVYVTGYQRVLPVIMVILSAGFLLLVGWVVLYTAMSSKYKRNMVFFDAGSYLKDSNTKRRIAVGISPCVSSPVTVGLVKPAILLPVDHHEYEDSMEEVILHELNHISCMDIVERFLGFTVAVLYFFDPFVYYLLRENIAVSEMLSDEAAVKGRTKKQKADYIRCIIAASQGMDHSGITTLTLGVSKSLLRKRMEQIMGKNEKKSWKMKAVAAVVAGCALAGSIPALAYQKPREYVQSGENDWNDKNLLVFAQTGEENPMNEANMDFSHGDIFFADEDGIMDPLIVQEHQTQKQDVCAHSYTSGTISEHDRHADESCTVVIYQAQKCTKCGNVMRGDEVSTFHYKVCTHAAADITEKENKPAAESGVVNTDALRMRSAADSDSEVLALLKKGESVQIIAEENDFYKISLEPGEDGAPMEGYVRKEYLDCYLIWEW